MVGFNTNTVYQYELNTPYDLSTVSTSSPVASYQITDTKTDNDGNSPFIQDITFNEKGDKMFIVDKNDDEVYQFSLSTNHDLNTNISYDTKHNVNSEDGGPVGLAFNEDGSKMFISGNGNNKVYEYTVPNNFDLSSKVQFTGNSLNVGNQTTLQGPLRFRGDGKKIFIPSRLGNIYQYNLDSGYSLSQSNYNGITTNTYGTDGSIAGIAFNSDGTTMIISGSQTNTIYEYSTSAEK